MARLRTLKSEFWSSPQVVECSRDARLTFIGLLNFCDDNGIHPASPRRLKMEVFPGDSVAEHDVAAWVTEIERAGLIESYTRDGIIYWHVTGWDRHQKIDKPTYRHPLPDGQIGIKFSETHRRMLDETSAKARRILCDPSGTEWSGVERSGGKAPSQGGDGVPTTSLVPKGGSPEKPRHRKFVVGQGVCRD